MRKTKIICTLGPSTDGLCEELIKRGMDTARLNLSHGTYGEHILRINELKRAREKLNRPIALLMDTKGPEIRTGTVRSPVKLIAGNPFILYNEDRAGDERGVKVSHPELYERVNPSDTILIDDGKIVLKVESISNRDIHCTVISGGVLTDRKGINIPFCDTGLCFISQKDKEDIDFAILNDFDYIALSFVSGREDIDEVRRILVEKNCKSIKLISKIENRLAVEKIDEIIDHSDGIMVARGDLGVEIPLEQVPIIQKKLIKKCYFKGKPVITATQMLESMVENPRPTRAEVSDVANAIYDGTSGVMLSGETASGKNPVLAVDTMARIVEATEKDIDYKKRFHSEDWLSEKTIVNIIGQAATVASFELDIKAFVAITNSGNTARMISRFRPETPIIALCVDPKIQRQLNMSWGIIPLTTTFTDNAEVLYNNAIQCAIDTGMVREGDLVILVSGLPIGSSGKTNMIKIHRIKDAVF